MRFTPVIVFFLLTAACGDDKKSTDTDTGATDTSDVTDTQVDDTSDPDGSPDLADGEPDSTDPGDLADIAEPDSDTSGADADPEVEVDPNASWTALDLPSPVDITTDGAFVAIWDGRTEMGDTWIYEVAAKSLTLEVSVGSPLRNFPTALSDNLAITALHGEPVQAGLWDGATWRDLGSILAEGCGLSTEFPNDGDIGAAWDVSADGAIVVGALWDGCTTVAFRWSDDGTRDFRTLEVLGSVAEGATLASVNRATVVSDDGSTAAGFAQSAQVDRWPAVWDTASAEGTLLTTEIFPSDAPGEVLAISPDGSIVGGIWNNEAFIATLGAPAQVTKLDPLPGVLPGEASRVNALAKAGTLAFGQSGGPFLSIPQAFVWTRALGTRSLKEVAIAHGLTLADDLTLTNVLAASEDGSVVVGTFLDSTFLEKTFILTLSPTTWN
jgi:hypothetical protein